MENKAKKAIIELANGKSLQFVYFISDANCNAEQKEMNLVDLTCRLEEFDLKTRITNPNDEEILFGMAKNEVDKYYQLYPIL